MMRKVTRNMQVVDGTYKTSILSLYTILFSLTSSAEGKFLMIIG